MPIEVLIPVIVGGFLFMLIMFLVRRQKRIRELMYSLHKDYPDVWNHFSVVDTEKPVTIPAPSYNRLIYSYLPEDLRQNMPTIFIKPKPGINKEGIEMGVGTVFSVEKAVLGLYEQGVIWVTALQSIIKMSDKLGVSGIKHYKQLVKILNCYASVAENNGAHLYCLTKPISAPSLFGFVEKQLIIICSAMNADYNVMGLGDYDPGSNRWVGIGSWGAFGLGMALSAGSKMKRSAKKEEFKNASTCAAINHVIEHFNAIYHP